MGCVARKQNAPLSPFPGDPCPERIDRLPFDPDGAFDFPGFEQPIDEGIVANLVCCLARQDHEFPAMAPFAHEHTGRGALGIADLKVRSWQSRIIIDENIDHQPGLFEVQIFKGNGRRLANG